MGYTLGELAKHVQGRVIGDVAHEVNGVGTLESARSHQIAFLTNTQYKSRLSATNAGAVIVDENLAAECPVNALVVDRPHAAYARIANLLYPAAQHSPSIHPTAVIDPSVQLPARISVGAYAVIEADCELGDGCYIGAHSFIGRGARLGKACELVANVTVLHEVVIGDRALLHPGVVIGSDGFGQAFDGEGWIKIPQVGTVRIGDDVEIGANTTVDRGAIEDTVIEDGVKLDNQIQIAHNVRVGAHTVIAGCTGIAGSSKLGHHCLIGGGVGISGHINIADGVTITGMSLVTKSITEPGSYSSGMPAEASKDWRRKFVRFRQLGQLIRRVEKLEALVNRKQQGE